MAQVPTQTYSDEEAIDYTPSVAVTGGDVVVLNGIVGVAITDIAASDLGSLAIEGIFQVPKTTAAWVRGLAVHWNATGDPDSGTAGTGAANQLGSTNVWISRTPGEDHDSRNPPWAPIRNQSSGLATTGATSTSP